MRIEKVSEFLYNFFINSGYSFYIDYDDQDDLINLVKRIVLKYKKRLGLKGFYKVNVYPVEKVGIFIDLINMDMIEVSNNIDLRVVVHRNKNVYFETDDYFIIDKYKDIMYYNKLFYLNILNIEDINKVVDFGRFVLEDDIDLSKGITIGGL